MCSREMKSVPTSLPTKAESYGEPTEGVGPSSWSHLGRKLRPVCLTPLKKRSLAFSFVSSVQCKCTEDDTRPHLSCDISPAASCSIPLTRIQPDEEARNKPSL